MESTGERVRLFFLSYFTFNWPGYWKRELKKKVNTKKEKIGYGDTNKVTLRMQQRFYNTPPIKTEKKNGKRKEKERPYVRGKWRE